jgi:hypothetical protein
MIISLILAIRSRRMPGYKFEIVHDRFLNIFFSIHRAKYYSQISFDDPAFLVEVESWTKLTIRLQVLSWEVDSYFLTEPQVSHYHHSRRCPLLDSVPSQFNPTHSLSIFHQVLLRDMSCFMMWVLPMRICSPSLVHPSPPSTYTLDLLSGGTGFESRLGYCYIDWRPLWSKNSMFTWNLNVYQLVHKGPPLDTNLSHLN